MVKRATGALERWLGAAADPVRLGVEEPSLREPEVVAVPLELWHDLLEQRMRLLPRSVRRYVDPDKGCEQARMGADRGIRIRLEVRDTLERFRHVAGVVHRVA